MKKRPKVSKHTVRPDAALIRKLRLAKGWTAEDLAHHAGHSLRTIENVEAGEGIYISTLANIAAALGRKPQDFLEGAVPQPKATINIAGNLTFDPEVSNALIQIAEKLAEASNVRWAIYVMAVSEGSVHIGLDFERSASLWELLIALAHNHLEQFGVTSITVHTILPEENIRTVEDIISLHDRLESMQSQGIPDPRPSNYVYLPRQPYYDVAYHLGKLIQSGLLDVTIEADGDWLCKPVVRVEAPELEPVVSH